MIATSGRGTSRGLPSGRTSPHPGRPGRAIVVDHAVLHGMPHNMQADLVERGLGGHDLREHSVTVLTGFDHGLKAADLALETA